MNPLEDHEGQALVALLAGYVLGVLSDRDALIPLEVRDAPILAPDGTFVTIPFQAKSGRNIDVTVRLVE